MERWSLVGVFDFVGFRVFRGSLDRRVYRGDAKVAEGRKEREEFWIFGGREDEAKREGGEGAEEDAELALGNMER